MRKLLYIFILTVFMVNCQHKSININPNKASLTFNGQSIEFDDVRIEPAELDLEAGMGFRAFAEKNLDDINGYSYYIILDYQEDSLKKYQFHKLNFGVKKKTSPTSYYQVVYAASLTPGYNDTNFEHSTTTIGPVAEGTFSGRLRSLYDGTIEVSKGTFHLDFRTVRDY
ncbi:MAG: hypothetical protein KKG00_02505 [Bacteroidetes bacterium]|nr:hypothetical protein [Bacteroidota bacterium]